MSVPAHRVPCHGSARWETIRYALGTWGRTFRLCLILLVASITPAAGLIGLALRMRW